MRRRILLTGPIGCGKSTLIKNALGRRAEKAGGFITQRVLENGTLKGFDLSPARALNGGGQTAYRFLSFGEGGVIRDGDVFRTEAPRLLREAVKAPFAVLDEFGGYELLLPEFMSALDGFLGCETPAVGVLKALPAAAELKARTGLPPDYLAAAAMLRQRLDTDPDTLLLPTFGRGDERAERALLRWVNEYVGDI